MNAASATMKSVFRTRYGPPEVLEVREVPRPEPGPGEVLVRVHAATVSRTDCAGLSGAPFVYRFFAGFPRPRHAATGCDFAGEVAAVGRGVTTFREGDRVWGFDDNCAGTHAEYVTFRESAAITTIALSPSSKRDEGYAALHRARGRSLARTHVTIIAS